MPAPIKPEDFKNIIPAANARLCTKMVLVLIKLPLLLYRLFTWMFTAEGKISDEFKAEMGLATGTISAPTDVTASDGSDPTKITITWTAVANASRYDVYRSSQNDSGTATLIAPDVTATSYIDTPPTVDTLWFYWVKAKNEGGTSAYSLSDSGFAGSTGTPTGTFTHSQSPTGNSWIYTGQTTNTASIDLWAAGGGGGGWKNEPWATVGGPIYGGGGGGSGERRQLSGITLTNGEELKIFVGAPGGVGATGGSGGGGGIGGDTVITRLDGTVIGIAKGGRGGGVGTTTAPGEGGAGGTGGTGGTGFSGDTGTSGQASKVGGVGGAEIGGGGNQGGNGADPGSAGGSGKIVISW